MHFVKHSLILAMLAVLSGCGGSSSSGAPTTSNPDTPAENTMVVSGVNTNTAIIGTLSTFILSGSNMSSNMQVSLPNCENISALSGSTISVKFTCTPRAAGTQVLTVKTAAGATLFTSNINLQATAPAETVLVNSVEIPSKITVGDLATFTINGQNLSGTLQVILPQCQNLTPISITPTKIVFTCTPQVAGAQKLTIRDANGVTLDDTRTVTVQNPAPTLTGSWRQSVADGCTGTIEGETIVGVRSKLPLFTFIKDSDTQVRLIGNEGVGYLSTDCSETTPTTSPDATIPPQFALSTGMPKFTAIYSNVGAVQQTSGLHYYYPVETSYNRDGTVTANATAIVFKDKDTFCLFGGVVSAANISQFIQSISPNTPGCFARSSKAPFSQEAPTSVAFFSKSVNALLERSTDESILNLLSPINQRGQTGYVLLGDSRSLRPEINGNQPKTYNLFTQIDVASGFTFQYRVEDEPVQDANFAANRLSALNALGLQGFLYLGQTQLSPASPPKTLYAKTSPAVSTSKLFAYQMRSDSDLTASKLVEILDGFGATGCRFVDTRLQATATNTRATVCVNSNRHNGTFSYRYVPYPVSTRTDALKALLDTQKSNGFYPIRVMSLGAAATPHILFEYDSTIATNVGLIQYKVYSQALPSNQPELISLLNDQGTLGWHLWSEINDVSGNPLATIFASLPFPSLADGEPVVLNRR